MNYKVLKDHYESCLAKHGEGHLAVDWPNEDDAKTRHRVMLELTRGFVPDYRNEIIIDFGCGLGDFFSYYLGHSNIPRYLGVDISPEFIKKAIEIHPSKANFQCLDITACPDAMPRGDYIIANGVFTEKREMTQEQMWDWVKDTLTKLWDKTDVGLAANFMTPFTTTPQRDDLFHLSVDLLMGFCCENLSRNIVIRQNYGLWEYTIYVYK